jgi:hypothetical protein
MGSADICSSGILHWNESGAADYCESARALNERKNSAWFGD